MKRVVGETVRIRSKEWMDEQEKTPTGCIDCPDGSNVDMLAAMQRFAGKTAKIVDMNGSSYTLDIDDRIFFWEDWMFDPDFKSDAPLSAKDAIRAMLGGEILERDYNVVERFNGTHFVYQIIGEDKWTLKPVDGVFTGLRRRPVKRKRKMTRWEAMDWANSEASRGWVVKTDELHVWRIPQFFSYDTDADRYQRARLLPDLSGVDESTIQGIEVEK
jgi:hypothetical protein